MTTYDPDHDLVIWGASGHALMVAELARLNGGWQVAGFLDDRNSTPRAFCGATVLGDRSVLPALHAAGVRQLVVAFGDCAARLACQRQAEALGFTAPVLVHPRAAVSPTAQLGAGTVVAAGAVVNPAVQVGRAVIVNTGACVDHECTVGDGAHICPRAALAGTVTVGETAWVGIGSVTIEGISIGARALVGAGAVVVRDVPPDVVAYGNPARIVRRRPTPTASIL